MSDLAEVRRFWPRATGNDDYYKVKVRGVSLSIWATDDYGAPHWEVCVIDGRADVAKVRANRWHQLHRDNNPIGPTIAAAMAAAGFGVRPIGRYRETFNQFQDRTQGKAIRHRAWHKRKYRDGPVMLFADLCNKHDDGRLMWPVLLESRQRPRKGVRLGKARRTQAVRGGRG